MFRGVTARQLIAAPPQGQWPHEQAISAILKEDKHPDDIASVKIGRIASDCQLTNKTIGCSIRNRRRSRRLTILISWQTTPSSRSGDTSHV
jgi:hypothetical protein